MACGSCRKYFAEDSKVKIRILTTPNKEQQGSVRFSSAIGEAWGCWKGNTVPSVGDDVDVEFDFESALTEGVNAVLVQDAGFGIREEGTAIAISGVIDGVDQDGMLYFRLAPDALVLVEQEPQWLKEGSWVLVRLDRSELSISPFGS